MYAMRSRSIFLVFLSILLVPLSLHAQDSATGSIRGVVLDAAGARVPWASIVVVNTATSTRHTTNSDREGRFVLGTLAPGDYSARVEADGMSPQVTPPLHVDVGGTTQLEFSLSIAGAQESLTISAAPNLVE